MGYRKINGSRERSASGVTGVGWLYHLKAWILIGFESQNTFVSDGNGLYRSLRSLRSLRSRLLFLFTQLIVPVFYQFSK